ncbi:MAG TPA: LamG-like jellyroll fold domain-containing protein, partial [Desulfobaccales bacterium]
MADYRLVVTNLIGSVTSSVAPLRLNQPVVDNSYQYAVFTNNPYAYWRMNEAPGSAVMSDTSPAGGFDASPLASTVLGVPGPQPTDFPGFESTNTALQLGIHYNDGYASFPPLNLTAQQSITITAWIMPNGPQQAHTGLVCLKGTGDGSLNYSTFTDASGYPVLGYTWGGGNGNWNTGLQPPFGSWSFVALVITPTDATMYLFNPNLPNGLSTAYLLNNNAATDFLAPGAIGADTFYVNWSGWTGIFDGDMDEVAVFNKALSPSLVETLYGKAAGISKYPVVILQQPVSAPVVAGGNAQLKVSALGTGLAYQWQARAIGSGSYTNLIDGGNLWGS